MAEVKEGLKISVEETPDNKTNPIELEFQIDKNGVGNAIFDASGQLDTVHIPENIVSTYNILCVNSSEPQDVVFNFEDIKGGVFSPRKRVHDQTGKVAESDYEKIHLSGNYTIKVMGAVPESTFSIKLGVI